MSVATPPVAGQITAASGSATSPASGSVVQSELIQTEQQCQIILSGTYTGQQFVIEAQDKGALGPWYPVRLIRQDTGALVWGGNAVGLTDSPTGLVVTSVIAAIEGAGRVRIRSVAFGTGALNALLLVGSFFATPPVLASASSAGANTASPTLLKVLRALERLLALQSGAWVGIGTDDGSGNTVAVDPSLGDTVG